MAAYAALVSLMNNIEQIKIHPRLSTSLDSTHIQPLLEKAAFLLDFIEGCYNHGGGSKEAEEDMERRIASAAHAAEDVIESHIVDQIHAGTSEVSPRYSLDLKQIILDIDAIIAKATEEKQGWREEKSTHTAGPVMQGGEAGMVGLDEELTQLLDELTGYQPSRHTISIVGMGGMGKTTLAKNIYQNSLIIEHFDIRAWATISQQYSAKNILSELLSDAEKSTSRTEDALGEELYNVVEKSTSTTKDALGEELYKTLYGRRYMIVLDDIWNVEAWDKVRRYFPDDENGSRVVLTTRLLNVANDCGSSSCLKMDLLDENTSWKLFCDKASFPQKDDPPKLEDIGKMIVRSCKGLALSIAVIGGLLLKSPRTVGFWMHVLNSIPNSKEKQESLDVLSLSYNHLPPHLKPCFLYMGLFKEDLEIRVSNIIKLWIGEGFLKQKGSGELEEVAKGYIKDLIDRNLILVGRDSNDGKIRFCGIHDLLRDLSLKIAKEQQFFHVKEEDSIVNGRERRLIGSFKDPIELPLARSIFIQGFDRCSVRYRLLRVFEDGYDFTKEDYSGHANLRYLAYTTSDNFMELPSSVCLVWNLQTLIIKQTWVDQVIVAPGEFWKLRQLRHANCYNMYIPKPPEGEVLMLEKLQTLKTALNLRLCEEVCNIIPNIKKLHLRYNIHIQGYDKSDIECLCNLDRLHKLKSLNLIFDYFTYGPTEVPQFNKILRLPSCLNKLSLKGCHLGWEDMTMIGSLPQLQVLNLDFQSVSEGREWRPVIGQFLCLKFLKIDHCKLTDWIADCSHFPVLKKLLLIGLKNLQGIPSGIGEIPTLELIGLEFCSESAAISAVKIKEDQLENEGNDVLQIQVKTSGRQSFKRKLEREGLTTDNIQLEII
ncbi:hypothetical protein C2S52_022857 [Perilla frutescens var. hirtella]|nr:hypothetical protein C2S52_022857 [Perilla frutescens var. hirtella]